MSGKAGTRVVEATVVPKDGGRRGPSYLVAALLTPANLFALLAGSIASLVTSDWIPLAAAAGASVAYFGLLSVAPSFRRAVRANFEAQALPPGAGAPDPLLDELSPSQRAHYESLRRLADDILARYRRMPGGRVLAASSEGRLDALLTSFLRLVSTLNGYRQFLGSADRKELETELAQLEAEVTTDTSEPLREVKTRRIEILRKRVRRYVQAEESREVVSHQLATIEDMLRLTHEQSVAIRDPQVVGEQLSALSAEVAATEESVRDLETFMQVSEELSVVPGPSPRERVR